MGCRTLVWIDAENARLLAAVRTAATHHGVTGVDVYSHRFADGVITRERSCEGKRAYRTLEYAESRVKLMWRTYRARQRPYFCNYCECYHLTTEKA
jgi:hypothetical protein